MMRIIAPILILLLTGCGGANVVVEGTFPEPMVETLPLHMGVFYSEKFQTFTYEEEEKGKGKYVISTGASQVTLFDTMFDKLFNSTTKISKLPTSEEPVNMNAVLAPDVEEIQFTVPRETRSKIFEVWIKFKMNLFSPKGDLIYAWPIPSYGKTPVAFMKSREEALEQAAIVALRDAGAHFAMSFRRKPEIQRWLDTQLEEKSSALAADENETSVGNGVTRAAEEVIEDDETVRHPSAIEGASLATETGAE